MLGFGAISEFTISEIEHFTYTVRAAETKEGQERLRAYNYDALGRSADMFSRVELPLH
jgi:hypothetical protein